MIEVLIQEDEKTKCKLCSFIGKNPTSLGTHVGLIHKLSREEYIIKCYLNDMPPKCKLCDNKPEWIRGTNNFREYCKDHANQARSKWSKEHKTFDYGWKKGLTKNDHPSIMAHSKAMIGKPGSINNQWLKENEFESYRTFYKENFQKEIQTLYQNYSNNHNELEIKCLNCNDNFDRSLNHMRLNPHCPFCEKECGESKMAREWLEYLGIPNLYKQNREVYFKLDGKIYFADGYDSQTNTIYEFLGDFWHRKPKNKNFYQDKSSM